MLNVNLLFLGHLPLVCRSATPYHFGLKHAAASNRPHLRLLLLFLHLLSLGLDKVHTVGPTVCGSVVVQGTPPPNQTVVFLVGLPLNQHKKTKRRFSLGETPCRPFLPHRICPDWKPPQGATGAPPPARKPKGVPPSPINAGGSSTQIMTGANRLHTKSFCEVAICSIYLGNCSEDLVHFFPNQLSLILHFLSVCMRQFLCCSNRLHSTDHQRASNPRPPGEHLQRQSESNIFGSPDSRSSLGKQTDSTPCNNLQHFVG